MIIVGLLSLWLSQAPPTFEDKVRALANSYFRIGAAAALNARATHDDPMVYTDDPRVFEEVRLLYSSTLGLDTNRWGLWPNIHKLTVLRD